MCNDGEPPKQAKIMTITLDALEQPHAVEVSNQFLQGDFLKPVEVTGIIGQALTAHAAELVETYEYPEQDVLRASVTLMNVRRLLVGRTMTSHTAELETRRDGNPFSNLERDRELCMLNELNEVIAYARAADGQIMPAVQPDELAIATTALELAAFAGSDLALRALAGRYMSRIWEQVAQADVPMTIS